MSRWAGRPARPVAPIPVAVMIIAIWWLVAHNGGSGWVQLLGDLVFGALCIGVLGPWLVVTRAKLEVRSAPADGVAGMPVEIRVDAGTRLRVRPVDPPGDEVFVGPARQKGVVDDRVTVLPVGRGVHDTVTLDIASAAPFAVQWWTRRVQLPLPSTLHVAPRRGRPPATVDEPPRRTSERSGTSRGPTWGCPVERAPTSRVTAGASCTGGRRRTPGSSW